MYIRNIIYLVLIMNCDIAYGNDTITIDLTKSGNYSIQKIKGFKKSKINFNEQSLNFFIGDNFIFKYKMQNELKSNTVYRLEYEVQCSNDSKELLKYGFSLWSNKTECTIPDPNTVVSSEEEHMKFPYVRIDTSINCKEWNKSTSFMYIGEAKSFLIFRSTGLSIKKRGLVKIKNIKLIEIKSAYETNNNLVINGDFEYYNKCPFDIFPSEGYFFFWQNVENRLWNCVDSRDKESTKITKINSDRKSLVSTSVNLNLGSPDFQCSCSALPLYLVPQAFSGNAFAKISTGEESKPLRTEYLQTELLTPLKKDVSYKIEFYYMRAPFTMIANNRLGIKLGTCPFSMDSKYDLGKKGLILAQGTFLVSPESPIMNSTWKKATFIYKAGGGEKFLTIGPFYNEHEKFIDIPKDQLPEQYQDILSWYMIDKVSVCEQE